MIKLHRINLFKICKIGHKQEVEMLKQRASIMSREKI